MAKPVECPFCRNIYVITDRRGGLGVHICQDCGMCFAAKMGRGQKTRQKPDNHLNDYKPTHSMSLSGFDNTVP